MTDSRATGSGPARKFVAASGREALRLAREALGERAMVLASRAIEGGFEVVAMAEDETAAAVSAARPLPPAEPAADNVLSELHSMRSMIEERLASVVWNEQERRDPVRGRLLRTMLTAGFSARLSKALLEKLPAGHSHAEGLAFVKSELLRTVPVGGDEEALLAQGGVYALVGPTGVGKTTTTAKLAARCVMRFGAQKLALVTTDSYRIGAFEQLRIYGQILDVPVFAVKDQASLQLVLQDLRDRHMVLIDTVGMSQRDRAVSDQVAMLCGAGRPVKRLLLLNAASHGDTLNEVVYAYQHAGQGSELAGCIFTKLDEAPSYGALLDTVIRHRLPVHYLSNGQKVPENLVTADRAQLVEEVLQPRAAGGWFAADAELSEQPPADASAQIASAQAQAERLRRQYQQLIRAMAHDAEEVGAAAAALAAAPVGFDGARRLWRDAAEGSIGQEQVSQQLLAQAREGIAAGCERHVLTVCARARLEPNEHGDSCDLHSALLLSDRDGQPLAAPNQWLATDAARKPGARQLQWLAQQDFGLPLVHVLPKPPAGEELARWQAGGQQWLARAPGSTAVVDPRSGEATTLARLAIEFGAEEPAAYRGLPARRAHEEVALLLRTGEGAPLPVRCVATRTVDGAGAPLEQTFLLASVDAGVAPRRLVQWQEWAAAAEPCVRLAAKGLQLLGGIGELGDPGLMKRLLVAGQVATTAWRVLQVAGERAERTRALLIELAGRQLRADRALSGPVVYEGLAKLFHLLDALGTDCAGETERAPSGSIA